MCRLYLKTIVNRPIAKQTAPSMTLLINNVNREIVNYSRPYCRPIHNLHL